MEESATIAMVVVVGDDDQRSLAYLFVAPANECDDIRVVE
jgi:hypothetical protein